MTAAVPIAPNFWRVPTTPFDLVNSFLVRAEDGSFTLVDAGLKSAPARITAALSELGAAPSEVTTIVLTHAHADHAGGAAGVAALTGTGVTAHEAEADYLRTGTTPANDPALRLGRLGMPPLRACERSTAVA